MLLTRHGAFFCIKINPPAHEATTGYVGVGRAGGSAGDAAVVADFHDGNDGEGLDGRGSGWGGFHCFGGRNGASDAFIPVNPANISDGALCGGREQV